MMMMEIFFPFFNFKGDQILRQNTGRKKKKKKKNCLKQQQKQKQWLHTNIIIWNFNGL
jgi:hypothetical protein